MADKEKKETLQELEVKIGKIKDIAQKKEQNKIKADAIKAQIKAAVRRKALAKAHELVCDADEVVRIVGVLAHRIKYYGHDACCDVDSDLFNTILDYSRGCKNDAPVESKKK